ncbi:MAG: WG repeat-containing protein, partial [Xanthomarina sp.]
VIGHSFFLNAQEVIFTNCEGFKGVINATGEIIVEPVFNDIESVYFNNSFIVFKDDKFGLYKNGLVNPGLAYNFLTYISVADDNFFIVRKDTHFQIADLKLKPISSLKFKNFDYVNNKHVFTDENNTVYEIENGKIKKLKQDKKEPQIYGGNMVEYGGTSYANSNPYKKENNLLVKTSVKNTELYYTLRSDIDVYKDVKALFVSEYNTDEEVFYVKNKEGYVGILGTNGDYLLPVQYKRIEQSEQNTHLFHVTTTCGAIGLFSLKNKHLYLPESFIEN